MPRELENLPGVLAQASKWGLDSKQVEALVKKISVRFEWTKPRPAPRPISFLNWLKQDPKRCPPLWFALVEHSDRYLSDPKFEYMNFEAWQEFANVHGVTGDEFLSAWWASGRRTPLKLVN
jgi:hypothetical protein